MKLHGGCGRAMGRLYGWVGWVSLDRVRVGVLHMLGGVLGDVFRNLSRCVGSFPVFSCVLVVCCFGRALGASVRRFAFVI